MQSELLKRMTPEQIDALYNEMRGLSVKLKAPFVEPMLRVHLIKKEGIDLVRDVIFDAERETGILGILDSRYYEKMIDRHAESYTRNAYDTHIYIHSGYSSTAGGYADGGFAVKKTDGVTLATFYVTNPIGFNIEEYFKGAVNNSAYGILIGTDTTPESFDDFNLLAQITHGTGAGQMQHAAGILTEGWVEDGTDYYWSEVERLYVNGSGGSITVGESGIYIGGGGVDSFCTIRDVWSPTIEVGVGEGIAVSYEFRVTFPADRS